MPICTINSVILKFKITLCYLQQDEDGNGHE
jgi:hypothetical protein